MIAASWVASFDFFLVVDAPLYLGPTPPVAEAVGRSGSNAMLDKCRALWRLENYAELYIDELIEGAADMKRIPLLTQLWPLAFTPRFMCSDTRNLRRVLRVALREGPTPTLFYFPRPVVKLFYHFLMLMFNSFLRGRGDMGLHRRK